MAPSSRVFEVDPKGLNLARGVVILCVAPPLVVLGLVGWEQYWLSVSLGALFVGLSAPGGAFGLRLTKMASIARPCYQDTDRGGHHG